MIRAQVIVRPRASIFDPQGDAVCRAIQHLGVTTVKQAHVGKCIELELESTDLKTTRTQLETICKDLLSNPVIEDYVLTLGNSSSIAKSVVKAKTVTKPASKKAKPVKKTVKHKPVKKVAAESKSKPKPKAKKSKKPAKRKK